MSGQPVISVTPEMRQVIALLAKFENEGQRRKIGEFIFLPASASGRRQERDYWLHQLFKNQHTGSQDSKVEQILKCWNKYMREFWNIDHDQSFPSLCQNVVLHRISRLCAGKVLTSRQIKNILRSKCDYENQPVEISLLSDV